MNVELSLKKIESLELDKKNLLVKLFDTNELLNNVKTENMLLLDKVKSLELDLSIARSASSKLDQILSVQKSPSDKSGLGFVESISVSAPHSTKFVPSYSSEPFVNEVVSETVKPPVSEVVKPIEVSPSRKIRVDLKESKPKESTLSKDKMHGKPAWVCHFCGKSRHIRPNCYKLQAAKRANTPKVPVPQAQDPIALIGELVKVLNFYSNLGVGNHSNVNTNSNARASLFFPFVTIVLYSLVFVFFLLFLGFALHNIHEFHSRCFYSKKKGEGKGSKLCFYTILFVFENKVSQFIFT